jgi:hypothetical protein
VSVFPLEFCAESLRENPPVQFLSRPRMKGWAGQKLDRQILTLC